MSWRPSSRTTVFVLLLLTFHESWKSLGSPVTPQHESSAVKFNRNAFDFKMTGNKGEWVQEFNVSDRQLWAINKSSVVVSIPAGQWHDKSSVKSDRNDRLWFNLTHLADGQGVMSAELRVYRNSNANNQEHSGDYNITVYRIPKFEKNVKRKPYVDSLILSAKHQGWIVLKMRKALRHSLQHRDNNMGISLSVVSMDKPELEISLQDIGIVTMEGKVDVQPFMVATFEKSVQVGRGKHPTSRHPNLVRRKKPSK